MAKLPLHTRLARDNALARLEGAAYDLAHARVRCAAPRAIAGRMTARRHAIAACEKAGAPEREIRRAMFAGNAAGFADAKRRR